MYSSETDKSSYDIDAKAEYKLYYGSSMNDVTQFSIIYDTLYLFRNASVM